MDQSSCGFNFVGTSAVSVPRSQGALQNKNGLKHACTQDGILDAASLESRSLSDLVNRLIAACNAAVPMPAPSLQLASTATYTESAPGFVHSVDKYNTA
jgi:hypothetical protein